MLWLEIDSGNTRTKWRLFDDATNAVPMRGITIDNSGSALTALPWRRCEVVRAVNVAGAEVQQVLTDSARAAGCGAVQFVVASARCGAIRNGYAQPGALGADRWAAIVGAAGHARGDVVIVDAGSAITVDLLSAGREHLGGYIGPGLRLARRSLGTGTDAVQVAGSKASDLGPGRSTSAAVHAAVLAMALGLIDNGIRQMQADSGTSVEPTVLVTGGDAEELLEQAADRSWRHTPDLVLDGLATALGRS